MKRFILTLIPAALAMFTACKSQPAAGATAADTATATAPALSIGNQASALPDAIVYRTNGNYFHNVPVTLNDARTAIANYPAPTDINDTSEPLRFAEGWMLDRRGIGPNTVFLDYTYNEYRRLPDNAVNAQALMQHIIPGSAVTEIRRLPIKLWKAEEDPVEASRLVGDSPTVYQAPAE